ncbi:DUF1501 domain-containing protein [Pyxidicoccus trucidator]|uniref:DUF1501 domain-containing protein n=1 Tax=Pyxidicoccus trucidator TaxID=2709662 RepID=UPI0013DA30B8|nr:DUF1501 domain-containing protein [Pyxidicoccus trucidator]
MPISRRLFLRGTSSTLGLLAASSTFPRFFGAAEAATLSGYAGYRAAVCVFLLGGNDGNNVLVPLTSGPHGRYLDARPNIGFETTELLAINPVGQAAASYGLHPSLTKLRTLFEQDRAALLCNVGPMVLPMDKEDFTTGTVARPDNLFSHADQQDAWASAVANPSTWAPPPSLIGKVTGWAGRTADKLHTLNPGEYPEVTSFGGKPLFSVGGDRQPMVVSPSGVLEFTDLNDVGFSALRADALAQAVALDNGVALEASYGGVFTTAQTFAAARTAARAAAWSVLPLATRNSIDTLFTTPAGMSQQLRDQLYQVLQDLIAGAMPAAQGGLGVRRQVYSVGLGGFDTHANQRQTQDELLAELDFALDAFYRSVDLLRAETAFGGNPPQATLFTMSDFGRTLLENSDRGTDHGWGNHAIVLGERVQGRRLYGTFPSLDLSGGAANNPNTTDAKGRWIPTLTVDQYSFSIASWLGLSTAAERDYVFPNLDGYVQAAKTGGFPLSAQAYKVAFMLPDA